MGGGEFLNVGVRCGSMWRSNPERILKRSMKMDPGGSPEADAEVEVKDFLVGFEWDGFKAPGILEESRKEVQDPPETPKRS